MFGNGRQRRMLRRAARFAAVPAPFLQDLSRANQLMAVGGYQQAAELFAQLALQADKTGHPRKSANLYALAAQAAAEQPNREQALAYGRAALNGFTHMGMLPRSAGFLAQISLLLRKKGLEAEANLLQLEFGGQPLKTGLAPAVTEQPAQPRKALRLPPACPQCGAPARSDEVEWIDEQSAECAYCGGVIQAA